MPKPRKYEDLDRTKNRPTDIRQIYYIEDERKEKMSKDNRAEYEEILKQQKRAAKRHGISQRDLDRMMHETRE